MINLPPAYGTFYYFIFHLFELTAPVATHKMSDHGYQRAIFIIRLNTRTILHLFAIEIYLTYLDIDYHRTYRLICEYENKNLIWWTPR